LIIGLSVAGLGYIVSKLDFLGEMTRTIKATQNINTLLTIIEAVVKSTCSGVNGQLGLRFDAMLATKLVAVVLNVKTTCIYV
jgi:hypothetical protein